MLLTNYEMESRLSNLSKLLPHRDKVGYFAARNSRILNDNLTEYLKVKEDLIRKHATEEDGDEVRLKIDSKEYKEFREELDEFGNIEHEVTLMTMKYEDVIGLLSGEEILASDWMFED